MFKQLRQGIRQGLRRNRDFEEFRFYHTSAMISRKEREPESDDEYMTGVIKLFNVNNPHKTMQLPVKTLEFPNMEKIRLRNVSVSYYLEGNDIIVNDIIEMMVSVDHRKHKITVRAFQKAVEAREQEPAMTGSGRSSPQARSA